MDITKFDLSVTVVMSLAIISMSLVMPGLGLTNAGASEGDIPDLSIDSDRFSIAEDRPPFPNTATEGRLYFNTTIDESFSETELWLEGSDTSGGVEITLVQNSTSNQPKVSLLIWDAGSLTEQDEDTLNSSNPRTVLTAGDYTIGFQTTEDNNPPDYLEVRWDIRKQATTDSWIGRIPGVGALFSTADLVASVIAWGITVFIWFSTNIIFGALNLIGIIVDVSVYLIALASWLIETYSAIVAAAPDWVGIFVALPGILLTLMLAKFVMILFRSLPTT